MDRLRLVTEPAPRAPMREHHLTLGGTRTRAIEVDGDGAPLVLLHGFCDSADTWRNLLERLTGLGRAAIAYDFPGYGFAHHDRDGSNLLERQLRFAGHAVEAAARRWGGPAIVAGNSLGGWTAIRVTGRPDLPIAGLIPIAPAGWRLSPWFARLDAMPGIRRLLATPAPVPDIVVREAIKRAARRVGFGDPARVDERYVRSFARHNRDRRKVMLRIADAQAVSVELQQPPDFDRVEAPSVMVWGDRDLLCLPEGAASLAEALGAELIMVPRCGHLPQVEAPESVLEALEKIDRLIAAGRLREVEGPLSGAGGGSAS